jgi:putative urate catabolism protein
MPHDHLQRDLVGYGANPPDPQWPNRARVCVSFVLNYEEGGENTVVNGDAGSEVYLTETPGGQPFAGMRDLSTESVYEYGSRAGFWRIMRLFAARNVHFTSWAVGRALELNPAAGKAMADAGHEVASHGWRWINYQHVPLELERELMQRAIEVHRRLTGERPLGWYTGRTSPNTRLLVVEDGGFVYDADDYNDDIPWYDTQYGKAQLVVPYTLDANDMRFATPQGFNSGDDFFTYLKDSFDVLYAEEHCMMSIGLHCRLAGRPGRLASLERFIRYVKNKKVWITRRIDIARHWLKHHPHG